MKKFNLEIVNELLNSELNQVSNLEMQSILLPSTKELANEELIKVLLNHKAIFEVLQNSNEYYFFKLIFNKKDGGVQYYVFVKDIDCCFVSNIKDISYNSETGLTWINELEEGY